MIITHRHPTRTIPGLTVLALFVVLALIGPGGAGRSGVASAQDDAKTMLNAENRRVQALSMAADRVEGFAVPPAPPQASVTSREPGPCHLATATRRVDVANGPALEAALAAVRPGDSIVLAEGTYVGTFGSQISGTAERPITLCGSRAATLTTDDIGVGSGFHLQANHWRLSGFTVRTARHGLLLEGANDNRITQVAVQSVGEEGIALRRGSSRNVITYTHVQDVGLYLPQSAIGISIGSTAQNWCIYAGCEPDRADANHVVQSVVGPAIPNGGILVREGTTGTTVVGNTFFGSPVGAAKYSWVVVAGNGATVRKNVGITTGAIGNHSNAYRVADDAPVDWGLGNDVTGNAVEEKVEGLVAPFRTRFDDQVSLVLPRRESPYSLGELIARFPVTFGVPEEGVVLVREHVFLNHQGHLVISADPIREIRMLSDVDGFVSVIGFRGEIDIEGHGRLTVTSWDPAIGGPDTSFTDGRPYLLVRASRMDISDTTFSHLGFGIGQTSGVAWKGFADDKSTGEVTGSRFQHNYFGAYTYEAEAMRWTGNAFVANEVYGFDPHDYSNHFVFERNVAHGNGSHGIIFSRGCDFNVIRFNASYDNRGHGIVLDDGKVIEGTNVDPRYAVAVPSNGNVVTHNGVWGNDVGIALEGGSANVVRLNAIGSNRYGLRLKNAASANILAENAILANEVFGIFVYSGSAQNRIAENTIRGGIGGIILREAAGNVIARNDIGEITGRGIALMGQVQESHVAENLIAGQGSQAVDLATVVPDSVTLSENQTGSWQYPRHTTTFERIVNRVFYNPAIALWAVIFGFPMLALVPGRYHVGRVGARLLRGVRALSPR